MATEEPAIFVPDGLEWAWVAVPRCASASVRESIHKLLDLGQRPQSRHAIARLPDRKALAASDRVRFAVVRDPWRRILSCYLSQVCASEEYPKNRPFWHSLDGSDYPFHPEMSFEQFVDGVSQIPDAQINAHAASQFDLLSYDGQLVIDKALRLSHLVEDWSVLQRQFGFADLSWQHKTAGDLATYYDTRLLDVVATRYAVDIENFNFERPDWS